MIAPSMTRPATLEEFERLPVGPPNFEFEEGKIVAMPSPTPDHQDVERELGSVAFQFVRRHKLGRVFTEVDVYLPDGSVYVPDISFLSAERLHLVSPINKKIYGAPDLCVEVISQDEARDRVKKFRVYLSNGVLWHWLIDPHTLAIEEYRLTPDGYVRAASVAAGEVFSPGIFPRLQINLADILGISPLASSEEQTNHNAQTPIETQSAGTQAVQDAPQEDKTQAAEGAENGA